MAARGGGTGRSAAKRLRGFTVAQEREQNQAHAGERAARYECQGLAALGRAEGVTNTMRPSSSAEFFCTKK